MLGTQWALSKYLFDKWMNEWTSKWSWTSCPPYLFSSCDFWMHCLVVSFVCLLIRVRLLFIFTSVRIGELFACHIGTNIFFPANMVCFIFSNRGWTLGSQMCHLLLHFVFLKELGREGHEERERQERWGGQEGREREKRGEENSKAMSSEKSQTIG